MTDPGRPRYLLLDAASGGARLAGAADVPVVGVCEPGYAVRLVDGEPAIEALDGASETCAAAVASGHVKLAHAGDAALMRFLFQTWVRNEVWSKAMRALARSGENVREWKLNVEGDALALTHQRDGRVARHDAEGWWSIVDPDLAAGIATRLTGAVARRMAA